MTDIFLPVSLDVASVRFRYLDTTGASRNPYNAGVRTAARGGDKLGCSLEFTPAGGASTTQKQKRAKLTSLVSQLSRANRVYLYDPGYVPRGSFATLATELLTNNDFSNGTTGLTAGSSTLSVQDNVLRVAATTGGASTEAYRSAVSLTQYAPHALRSFTVAGNWPDANYIGPAYGDGVTQYTDYSTTRGLRTAVGVALGSSGTQYAGVGLGTGIGVGSFYEIAWSSLSRCVLIDNGPNSLLQSNAFNTTWSVTRASVTANSVAAPDGTTTADTINEDGSAATTHFISQDVTVSSAAAEYSIACSFKAGTRTWAAIRVTESTGAHVLSGYINLSTGAVGTVASSGANWTNARAFAVSEGNSWYRLHVVGRKSSAATTLTVSIYIAELDNDITFSGGSAASMYAWRASLAQSSMPVRGTTTTTTATTGTSQSGSSLYVKGLPASTSGLLLEGDWVEVTTSLGSQLTKVTASLDSDAAGLGYLRVSPPVRGTVADNAAIIVNCPMGRFIIAGDAEYMNQPGIFSTASAEFEEAPA